MKGSFSHDILSKSIMQQYCNVDKKMISNIDRFSVQ